MTPTQKYALVGLDVYKRQGLGCSVYAHAIDSLKGVDLAFNNFCRDFKLGGKKVFYNRDLTKTIGLDKEMCIRDRQKGQRQHRSQAHYCQAEKWRDRYDRAFLGRKKDALHRRGNLP